MRRKTVLEMRVVLMVAAAVVASAALAVRAAEQPAFPPPDFNAADTELFEAMRRWRLNRARELDMVPIVNYFYQHQVRRIREVALPAAGSAKTHAAQAVLRRRIPFRRRVRRVAGPAQHHGE